MLTELSERGELVGGEALADPAGARLYRWEAGTPLATDGPYAEAKEHLAGFFLIDVESRERAEEVAAHFSGPGETVELRPRWASAPSEPDRGATWTSRRWSRTCGGASRRTSSARCCAGTATSATARTPRRRRWPPRRCSGRATGFRENPRGWLIRVASRRLVDQVPGRPGPGGARGGGRRP